METPGGHAHPASPRVKEEDPVENGDGVLEVDFLLMGKEAALQEIELQDNG